MTTARVGPSSGAPRALVILGGGGHAAVVAESARRAGFAVVAVASGGTTHASGPFDGVETLGDPLEPAVEARIAALVASGAMLHAAVGDALLRERWHARWQGPCAAQAAARDEDRAPRAEFATIVDPAALVSESARLGAGAFIGAGAVVQARATVGAGAIVNTRAIVEHDCALGAFSHVSPGAILCGGVRVEQGAQVGAGAVVIPSRTVGAHAVVGAGAVVTRDVAPRTTVVGVPAHERAHETVDEAGRGTTHASQPAK